MTSKIFTTAIFVLAFTMLSSFAPKSTPMTMSNVSNTALVVIASNVPTEKSSDETNPKADKKAKRIQKAQKLLSTQAGKWIVEKMQKRAEKRQAKLSERLAIAQHANDTKKVDKIKKKMEAKRSMRGFVIALVVIGLLGLVVGLVINEKNIYIAAGVVLFIGLILLLVDYLN